MKKISAFFISIIILLGIVSPIFAQSGSASNVNSFELFWPMVAGKTQADSLYSLKRLKENLRGVFIFGGAQKADYNLLLATKRSLEAEKLLNEDNKDLANKTLDDMNNQLNSSLDLWKKDRETNNKSSIKNLVGQKLSKLDIFLTYLSNQTSEDPKTKITDALNKTREFQSSLF
jgi:hypothetical protein